MTPTWTCEWCGNVSLRSEDYLLHKKDCLVRRSANDYDLGVIDGTKDLTFEEAVTCGFSDPHSAAVTFDPLKKLFKLRRERLVSEGVL